MTVVELETLLHCHYRCAPLPDYDTPSTFSALSKLIEQGLIYRDKETKPLYNTTDKGKVMVEALKRVPVPTPTWTCVNQCEIKDHYDN